MAKVSTTLQNVENAINKQNKNYTSEKQQRELEKQYKKHLRLTIKEKFYMQFKNSLEYKKTYYYLINNCDEFIEELIDEISGYFEYSDKEYWNNEQEIWKTKKTKVYPFDNFDIEIDVQENYFKYLKQVYEEYKIKYSISNDNMSTLLENNLRNFYSKYDYTIANNFCYDLDVKKDIIENLSDIKREQDYLDTIYFKILNKVSNEFKKVDKINNPKIEETTTSPKIKQYKREKQGNVITRHPVATMGCGVIYGLAKGFFKGAMK